MQIEQDVDKYRIYVFNTAKHEAERKKKEEDMFGAAGNRNKGGIPNMKLRNVTDMAEFI